MVCVYVFVDASTPDNRSNATIIYPFKFLCVTVMLVCVRLRSPCGDSLFFLFFLPCPLSDRSVVLMNCRTAEYEQGYDIEGMSSVWQGLMAQLGCGGNDKNVCVVNCVYVYGTV